MSKKILFLNTTKLAAISAGLLLVVFCVIGMSFRPVYGEDEAAEIVMSGPRYSHWHWTTSSGGCNPTTTHHYKSSVDYAQTQVQTRGNGSATISTTETTNVTSPASGNPRSASTSTTAGNTVSISWNSGLSHGDQTSAAYTNDQIVAAHKKVFQLEATPINDDYYFFGWGTSTSESSIFSADNPCTITSNMGITGYTDTSGDNEPANYKNSNSPYTDTYYAFFKYREPANITLKVPTNGTVKYSYESYSNVTLTAETTITTKYDVTLVAVPDENCRFYGWYTMSGSTENFISTSQTYTRAYPDDITIYAKFIPNSQATFNIKGTDQYYYDLQQALTAASSSSSKIVYPIGDGTVPAGNYTIPSGVTLLIPHDATITKQTTPAIVRTATALSAYRRLILQEGANITVNSGGIICVGGQIMSASGGSPSAYPTGPCGVLDMSAGGHIELNSGATLYVWGFIKGQDMDQGNNTISAGTINAQSGANVWEDFWLADWRGGSACSCLAQNSGHMMFPFQGYTIQNIEVPTTYNYGSTLNNYINVYGDNKTNAGDFVTIGNSNTLFLLKDSQAKVRKWYDPTTDLVCYELSGTTQIDALNVDAGITTVSSSSYNLPITSNMHVIINSNLTISKPMSVLPGAVLEIKNGYTTTISNNLYVYDTDDWGKGVLKYYFYPFSNLTSHKNRGTGTTNDLEDAKLVVDGTLNVTGKIYTTTGGANIMGNGGGQITLPSSLYGSPCLYQAWGGAAGTQTSTTMTLSYWLANGDTYVEPITVNSANLHNEDGSYTKTAASSTFYNINGRWFVSGTQNINSTTHVYDEFSYISSGAVTGTSGTTSTTKAVYAPDKTGLVAGMKWCNVSQDVTCTNIYNATQSLNGTDAANIRYTYPSSTWIQLLKISEGLYNGSNDNLYALDGCALTSLGAVDGDCLYTVDDGGVDVKKAYVNGSLVALTKNTEDEAWHNTADVEDYYVCFSGCTWHSATKYPDEEKAYIVEGGNYIWYNGDWKGVERQDPFFFDYNAQNVQVFYEYENGVWVVATPCVRVKDDIETREFFTFHEAMNVAKEKTNVTITLLKDAACTTSTTYSAKNTTCTIDLNGHTVHGKCATLLEINASGTTFTITDNSDEKNGRLENIFSRNEKVYNVLLSAGTLNFDAGTIYVKNTAQYHSSNLTKCEARGIQVTAEQKLNMTGGRVESYATRNAYGVLGTGSAANKTELNISGGSIYAEAPCGAIGINSSGKLNFGGTAEVEAHLNTDIVNAAYAADNASNNLEKHQTCYGINMTASANATASSCYFGTLNVTGGTIKASSALSRNYNSTIFGVRVYYSVAGMGNRNYASTSGTNAQQACAVGSVKNATIEVENKAKDTYGIAVYGHYNSYNKQNSVFAVENTSIDVKGYAGAYGIYSIGAIDGTTGECVTGDVEVTNCTVKTETTTGATAYATWVYSGATTIYKDKQANYYGEYAAASKMTINGGTYTAKTKTTSAYATGTNTRAKSTYGSESSVEANRTEGGHAEKYPTLIINGGTFNATSTTYAARGVSSGGNTTINDATFNVVAGSYNAFGLYAVSGKLTATNVIVNDTAKGRVSSSDSNGYAYGAFADCSIPSGNTAQTGFGYAGEIELNNCTMNVATTAYPTAQGIRVTATSKLHNMAQFKADSLSNKWATATYNAYYSQFPCKLQNKDSVWVGVAGKATTNGGTINVKAQTTSSYGAYVSRGVHYSYTTPNTVLEQCPAVLNINGTSFDVSTGTSTTAEGIRTYGTVNISGNTSFNVHPATGTAIGLRIYAGTTTVNGNPTFDVATGSGSATAYGAWVLGDTPADKTGLTYDGELIVNGGTFNVTTGTTTAYGILVDAKARQITSTAAGYYPGTYASLGHATINGGTFNVTAGTYGAFGVYVNRAITADNLQIFRGVADINSGTFNVTAAANAKKSNNCDGVLSYGTTTINGGIFNVESKNETTAANGTYAYGVYVADGTTTINKNAEDATKPLFNVKAYGTIYSVLVTAGQANATTGLTDNGYVIINGGTYNDTTTTDASSYGVCVSQPAPRVIASGDYAGTYYSTATATINDGTFNIYSAGTTAVGVYTGRNYTSANTKPNTFSNYTYGNATINGGTFNMSATTNAEGVRSHGTTVVNGGTFKPTSRTSTAYGLYVYAGTTTINNTYNPKFEVRAPSTAYGALVGGQPDSKIGLPYDGELTINGGDFDVQTTSGATAYGVNIAANTRKITSTSSGYYQGQYASAGTATINEGTFYIKATGATASAIYMEGTKSLAASSAIYVAASATPTCTITGGKFKVFASSAASAVVSTPLAENMPISGGYYNINTNLSKYAVSPKIVLNLHSTVDEPEYTNGYRYKIGEGYTITWKNGSTTLLTENWEANLTPQWFGDTPTKAEDDEYTYVHDSWTPTIVPATTAATYSATFTGTEKKYTVNVAAGANGSVSPASVSGIGCVTASDNITATPNTGYHFTNWTLPTGVTAAAGYSTTSNPIHIHATASGKTITAYFEANTYTITYRDQGDNAFSGNNSGSLPANHIYGTATALVDGAKDGYTFDGWYTNSACTGEPITTLGATAYTANITLYAKWTVMVVETGLYVDIVDVVNTNASSGTMTLNATNWPSAGWPYTINEVSYASSGTPGRAADRTLTIPYSGAPGDNFVIDIKKNGGESYSHRTYKIPEVISSATLTADKNRPIFVKGGTLTINGNITTKNIYVGADAKLVINSGKTLTADTIFLRTTTSGAAELKNNGSIANKTKLYYTRIIKDKSRYYQFGLPLSCSIDDVKLSDGKVLKYTTAWLLREYSESSRADNGGAANNWVSVADHATIVGGKGYEMFSASNYYREFYFPIDHTALATNTSSPVTYTERGNLTDRGWNVLVSPLTATCNKSTEPEGISVCWMELDGWGVQEQPTSIPPMKPFAYQASQGQSIVSFAGATLLAPRRRVAAFEEEVRIQWMHLDIEDANGMGDQTSIYSHPTRYEQTYKTGIDVAKQALTSTHAVVYSSHAYGDMAFAGVADSQLEQGVALTVYSPSAQELMISMRENDWLNRMEHVWLIDNETGLHVDLIESDYAFRVTEGTTRGRLFIQGQFKAPQITTDIEGGAGIEGEHAQKVIIDQKIYIRVNGRLYDATGKLVLGK